MSQTKGALQLDWRGIIVEVTITYNWLNTDHHHIELRADQPLPVSTTGYRSRFMLVDQFEAFESLEQLVLLWLDTAAKSSDWIKTQEDRKQLRLFD